MNMCSLYSLVYIVYMYILQFPCSLDKLVKLMYSVTLLDNLSPPEDFDYMYSFQPLIDYSATHNGWYLWLAVLSVIVLVMLWLVRDDELDGTGFALMSVALAVLSLVIHDNSYSDVRPGNEQVYATFVEYVAEGHAARSGNRSITHHNLYVVYTLDEGGGTVVLGATVGRVYPPRVVLYRN